MKVEFRNDGKLGKAYEATRWSAKLWQTQQFCPFTPQWFNYDGDPDDIAERLIIDDNIVQYTTMSGAGTYTFTPNSFTFEGAWRSLLGGCPVVHARPFAAQQRSLYGVPGWDIPEDHPTPFNLIGVELSIFVPMGIGGLCIYKENIYSPDISLDECDECEFEHNLDPEIAEIVRKHQVWLDRYARWQDTGGLKPADLSHMDLSGLNLSYKNLSYANLSHSDLRHTILQYANLSHANLEGADLGHANCTGANFERANLATASFAQAWVQEALFVKADLRDTSFHNARAERANFWGARLAGADFVGADIDGAAWPLYPISEGVSDARMDMKNISWFLEAIVNCQCDDPEFYKLRGIVKLFMKGQ